MADRILTVYYANATFFIKEQLIEHGFGLLHRARRVSFSARAVNKLAYFIRYLRFVRAGIYHDVIDRAKMMAAKLCDCVVHRVSPFLSIQFILSIRFTNNTKIPQITLYVKVIRIFKSIFAGPRAIEFGSKLFPETDALGRYFKIFVIGHNFKPPLNRKLVRRG